MTFRDSLSLLNRGSDGVTAVIWKPGLLWFLFLPWKAVSFTNACAGLGGGL